MGRSHWGLGILLILAVIRYLFSAAASAWVLPMSDKIGWGWTMTVSAAIVVSANSVSICVVLTPDRLFHLPDSWQLSSGAKRGAIEPTNDITILALLPTVADPTIHYHLPRSQGIRCGRTSKARKDPSTARMKSLDICPPPTYKLPVVRMSG